MTKYIKYTHPAARGYNASTSYELNEILESERVDMIKILFTPVNFKWEDLDEPVALKNNKRNR